jgi:hypothetical protein
MGAALRSCVVLLAAFTAASTADPDGEGLLRKVRARVLNDISRVPRYTCVQTVDRAQYAPMSGPEPQSCSAAIAARKQLLSPGYVVWRDRIRLDVTVLGGEETFSWAGARRFETRHVDDLVASGVTGNGEFASFLTSVFGGDADVTSFVSPSLFMFDMPLAKSHFTYRSRGSPARTTGYHGSFRVDPETADLKRLSILADRLAADEATCSIDDAMYYQRVKIGAGDFLVPSVATMRILYRHGTESMNETRFSSCREYSGESTISYADTDPPRGTGAPQPIVPRLPPQSRLPAGLRFHIGLASPLRSETAAAGDAVTGVVLGDVIDPTLGIVAREGDTIQGRVLQFEQFNSPYFLWEIAIRFDVLEHDGNERPIDLKSLDGDTYKFRQAGNLFLDQSFHSEWETR